MDNSNKSTASTNIFDRINYFFDNIINPDQIGLIDTSHPDIICYLTTQELKINTESELNKK